MCILVSTEQLVPPSKVSTTAATPTALDAARAPQAFPESGSYVHAGGRGHGCCGFAHVALLDLGFVAKPRKPDASGRGAQVACSF